MKIKRLLPSSFFASLRDAFSITLFFNKETDTVCYREHDGGVVEVGSNTAVISTILDYIAQQEEDAYTELKVSISSAQILAMGTTPVELLPAPGIGKYYEVEKILLEVAGTVDYVVDPSSYVYVSYNTFGAILASDLFSYAGLAEQKITGKLVHSPAEINSSDGTPMFYASQINSGLVLSYFDNGGAPNPTTGDGSMTAKIFYRIITFG